MDKLPTETVLVIAELIDRKDIPSFRLTCRSLAALGLPRQFEVIPVMLFRKSLENLLRISEHPVYSNYVLTIKYGGELVSNPKTRIEWTKYEWSLPGEPKKTFSESEVEEAYQSHVQYYDDQNRMKATGYDFKTLQSAISRLPNLRGVRIMSLSSENSARFRNHPAAWGEGFCSMAKVMASPFRFLSRWEPSYFVRGTVAVLAACKLAPQAISWLDSNHFELGLLSCDGDNNGDEGGGGGVNGGEDEVEADYRRHIIRLSRFNNFVRDPTEDLGPPLLCATFQSLTTVKLETSFTYNPSYRRYQQRLGTALRGAKGLQTLCINHRCGNSDYYLSFTPLLGSSTWPHLTHLSLSSITIHSHDLPLFLARHPSLTHFTLSYAFAHDFDWATLLQLPSFRTHLRQLHSLAFTDTWGANAWTSAIAAEVAAQHSFDIQAYLQSEDAYYYYPEAIVQDVNLNASFARWAQDACGARCMSEVLERYVCAEPGAGGEVEFPLRTGLEVGEALERVRGEEGGVLGYRAGSLVVVNEAVVGGGYGGRNLYSEYTKDGKEVVGVVESEAEEESVVGSGGEEEEGVGREDGLLGESVVGSGGEEEGEGAR